MQRIFADFSRLGMHGPGHETEIDLGYDDSPNLAGHELHEGERAIFYETGSLEAVGTLTSTTVAADHGTRRRFWIAQLDLGTIRSLDALDEQQPQPRQQTTTTTTAS